MEYLFALYLKLVVLAVGHIEQRHELLAPLRVGFTADPLLLLLCVPVVPNGEVAELVSLRLRVVDVCDSSLLVLDHQILCAVLIIRAALHVCVECFLQISLLGFLEDKTGIA